MECSIMRSEMEVRILPSDVRSSLLMLLLLLFEEDGERMMVRSSGFEEIVLRST